MNDSTGINSASSNSGSFSTLSNTLLPTASMTTKTSTTKYEFIHIHEPSGKANRATESHLRSHLMKQYHESRRQSEREFRPRKRRKKKGCIRIELCFTSPQYLNTAQTFPGNVNCSPKTGSNPQVMPLNTSTASRQSRSMILLASHTYSPTPQSFDNEIIPASQIACVHCGKLTLQYSPVDRETQLHSRQEYYPNVHQPGSHDPFDSLPIPINHRMHEMIHHFVCIYSVMGNPPIYSKEGFRGLLNLLQTNLLFSDAASVHGMVALSSYQLAIIKSNDSSVPDWVKEKATNDLKKEADNHVTQAVRLLNQKFADQTDSLSLESIIATSLLGSCTLHSGEWKQRVPDNPDILKTKLTTHHQCILKIIELRGGINTLPRGLANQMRRIDNGMAWKERSTPRLPMYKSRFHTNDLHVSATDIFYFMSGVDDYRDLSLKPASSPFQNNNFEAFLWGNMFSVACDLHGLSMILDLSIRQPSRMGTFEREFFEDTLATAEYNIYSFPYPNDVGVIRSTNYYRQHSWRNAALLYAICVLRKWDPAGAGLAIRAMTNELIIALQASDMDGLRSDSAEVLVWMLFVGSRAALDTLDRGWILLELRQAVRILRIHSVQELEWLLRSLIYSECILHETLHKLWLEIEG